MEKLHVAVPDGDAEATIWNANYLDLARECTRHGRRMMRQRAQPTMLRLTDAQRAVLVQVFRPWRTSASARWYSVSFCASSRFRSGWLWRASRSGSQPWGWPSSSREGDDDWRASSLLGHRRYRRDHRVPRLANQTQGPTIREPAGLTIDHRSDVRIVLVRTLPKDPNGPNDLNSPNGSNVP
jgi:hypothetical protein